MANILDKIKDYKFLIAGNVALAGLIYTTHTPDAQDGTAKDALYNAQELRIEERILSVGKDYDVLADGVRVATVSGKDLNLWADKFTLETTDGEELASEKENKRVFIKYNRSAEFFDAQGNTTGYLAEKRFTNLLTPGYIFHFFDEAKQEVGNSQKIGRGAIDLHHLYGTDGSIEYTLDHKFTFWGSIAGFDSADEYSIKRKDPNSKIPLEHAILLVCIEDAIKDSQTSK